MDQMYEIPSANPRPEVFESEIASFYKNRSILLTGGTGFLGKVLLEKLLRCTNIAKIYILIREKRGKDLKTRLTELFDDVIFDIMKKQEPNYRERIFGVSGDCSCEDLGLNDLVRKELIENVEIVFHVAATVNFNEKLRSALAINVNAAKKMMELGRQMVNLKSFVHVSTAYSHCTRSKIDETFYEVDTSIERVQEQIKDLTDDQIEEIIPTILGKWPNTYTFTKALAEDWINANGADLPIAVFRPSIVISTYKEPMAGWIDNLYGPTGTVVGTYVSILRTCMINRASVTDMVPVDMCVAALMAVAWNTSRKHPAQQTISVYNYVSSPENPIMWDEYITLNKMNADKMPYSGAIWPVFFTVTTNPLLYAFYKVFLHYLPALLIDVCSLLVFKPPRMIHIYGKLHKAIEAISHFSGREWQFSNGNVQQLWRALSPKDKEMFAFSMTQLHWTIFLRGYMHGVRKYLVKDADETLGAAKRRMMWLNVVKGLLGHLLSFLLIYVAYTSCSWFLSLVRS